MVMAATATAEIATMVVVVVVVATADIISTTTNILRLQQLLLVRVKALLLEPLAPTMLLNMRSTMAAARIHTQPTVATRIMLPTINTISSGLSSNSSSKEQLMAALLHHRLLQTTPLLPLLELELDLDRRRRLPPPVEAVTML